jgi:hypothetical protein
LTDEAIAILNDKFVPYAPRFADAKDGYAWWKEMHKLLHANKDEKFHLCTIPGTTFSAVTSAGQPVPARKAKHEHGKSDMANVLKQVFDLYKQVPETQRRPTEAIADANRPEPAPPVGGLVLVSYDRPLLRESNGRYRNLAAADYRENLKKHLPGQPGAQRDAFWLTAEDCQSLVPKNPQKGQTFSVPARLTKRIGLFALTVRSAFQEFYLWKPDSMRQGELKVTVESVSPKAIQMRLHGAILLTAELTRRPEESRKGPLAKPIEERYDARVEGQLVYDLVQKRFTRWDMVALGDLTGFSLANDFPGHREAADWGLIVEPSPICMSFEIDNNNYVQPPEYRRSTPYLIWRFRGYDRTGQHEYYFNPDKWEADWIKRGKK